MVALTPSAPIVVRPATGPRKSVLISLVGQGNADDLLQGHVIDDLAKVYDLAFIAAPKVKGIDALLKFGPVFRLPAIPPWRAKIYAIAKAFWHFRKRKAFVMTRKHRKYRSLIGTSGLTRQFINFALDTGLDCIIGPCMGWLLRQTTCAALPPETDFRPDCVLMVWGLEALANDDTIRACRARGVPLLGLQANLDNIATKTSQEIPPYAAVWGEASVMSCVYVHGMMPNRVFITGSPRFEVHRDPPGQAESRRRLGLPEDRRIVLFCGTGVPFNEAAVMDELQRTMDAGELPRDLLVIYRPHPNRDTWPYWETEKRLRRETDFLKYAPVDPTGRDGVRFYSLLFSACDAVLTPFSTMAMEAASYGRPVMCVAYNGEEERTPLDWSSAIYDAHLTSFHHGSWSTICTAQSEILPCFRKLLADIGNPIVHNEARISYQFSNKTLGRTCGDRVIDVIDRIIARETAA